MSETGKPLEIERKYLIKMPSEKLLTELPECERTEILQIYLVIKQDGVRRRIRRRGTPERGYVCTYTEKSDVSFGVRTEEEREISKEEFERLRAEAAPNRLPIEKERVVFRWRGQVFELDIYPFSREFATLEIELPDISARVDLPPQIELVKDVTGDRRFNNSELAGLGHFPPL